LGEWGEAGVADAGSVAAGEGASAGDADAVWAGDAAGDGEPGTDFPWLPALTQARPGTTLCPMGIEQAEENRYD